ncbi:hypothetical protein DSO57_1009994 [Entomophthora muscae]|uniref:Uncharacterized protein n=1 Tax=Entomophthora muscae TaxID=34485 RepID=A0ACC2RLF1_9FUNG|nr:hypothetical protein DSO57_1009994 [Entomophthora muscae]
MAHRNPRGPPKAGSPPPPPHTHTRGERGGPPERQKKKNKKKKKKKKNHQIFFFFFFFSRTIHIGTQDYNRIQAIKFKLILYTIGFVNRNNVDSLNKQGSSQESVSRGVAQYTEAHICTQIFVGNKEANLYLTPDPYRADLVDTHQEPGSVHAPFPDPSQVTNQQSNQIDESGLEQLPSNNQLAPTSANQALAPMAQHPEYQILAVLILQEIVVLSQCGLTLD